MGTDLVPVTDGDGNQVASASTSTRPAPPVEAVEAMFPGLRARSSYKVRVSATEDGRSWEYGWDVDGHLVRLTAAGRSDADDTDSPG